MHNEQYYIITLILAMAGIALITFAIKRIWVITGLAMLIIAGCITLMVHLWQRYQHVKKPVYTYIGQNLEDSNIDTIYSYDTALQNYVWVNMDSMFVNGKDQFATKYIVIKRIK